jgi:hypothetical protein
MYTPQPPDLQVQMAQLWNKYDIKAFPTLLATDSAGVEIDRMVGYASGYGPNKYIERPQGYVRHSVRAAHFRLYTG